jgi:hypothetical protein
LEKILPLEIQEVPVRVILHDVKNPTAIQTDAVFAREQDLAGIDDPRGKSGAMYRSQSIRYLDDIAPQDLFLHIRRLRVAGIVSGKVCFRKRLGQRVVVRDDYEGAIAKGSSGEDVNYLDDAAVADIPPIIDWSDGFLVREAKT